MDDKPRLFKFSLRTLLIGVTAICVWLGWERNISQERHRIRAWVESHGGSFDHYDRYRFNVFDDWQELSVEVPDEFSDNEFAEVKRAFPESNVFQRRRLSK